MPKSTIRLSLDVSDPVQRRRVERLFGAAFRVRRAVQCDARARVDAYWAAVHERAESAPSARKRLDLSRAGLERAARAAPHLARWCSKALGLHLADTVWQAASRHLFADSSGKRLGKPRVTSWWAFTRIPGRARSHTTDRKWETFRLHGTLAATRAAMRPPGWRYHRAVPTPTPAAGNTAWWDYHGPLQVVCTGVGDATIVLPVRLPTAPCAQAHLDHYLARPWLWHKVDLVRYRDPAKPGGWVYEAHLVCLTDPYVCERTSKRRAHAAAATAGRRGGVDVNVSNVTVASHHDGGDLRVTTIARSTEEQAREQRRRVKQRRRHKALDRSRRNTNPDQYHPSPRQQAAAKRRADGGLGPKAHAPAGALKTRSDGTPQRAYRTDRLSGGYRRGRDGAAKDARAAAVARRQTARRLAGELAATHGTDLIIEQASIAAWARTWGRAVHAFTPGLLVSALQREVAAIEPGAVVKRAGTRLTAMSQHCLCGHRAKKPLSQRVHRCGACGLQGARDAVAATLAACVHFTDPNDPTTAAVDYALASRLLADSHTRRTIHQTAKASGAQERPWAPTDTPNPAPAAGEGTRPPAPAGSAPQTGQVPTTTPDEAPPTGDHAGTRSTTNPHGPAQTLASGTVGHLLA